MNLLTPVLAAMLLQAPPIQRPTGAPATSAPAPVSATPAPAPAPAAPAPAPAPAATAPAPAPAATAPAPATPAPAPATPAPAPATPAPAPVAETLAPAPVSAAPTPAPVVTTPPVPTEKPGPPFYNDADMQALRARYGLEADPPKIERKPRFRCWVADPRCGFTVELNATSAYAYRLRQGNVDNPDVNRWHSARIQYDLWFSIPTVVETRGKYRYTRLSLGPKGGIVASDSKDIWGNFGLAGRYFFGRRALSPVLEFTTALVFKVAGLPLNDKTDVRFDNVRGPIGITADIGIGLGGFGSLVIGGQFDTPLNRTDVPESQRTSSAGMFFLGFRGNIAWGAPAAIAVGTHAGAGHVTSPR